MEIKEYQRKAYEILDSINKSINVKHDPDTIFLHLIEEIGEVAKELSKKQRGWREDFDKDKLGFELADVLFDLTVIAKDNGIDLEKASVDKLEYIKKRYKIENGNKEFKKSCH